MSNILLQNAANVESISAMVMYAMTNHHYQAAYNALSITLTSMMATTMHLWFWSFAVKHEFESAVIIGGLVTFIATYHWRALSKMKREMGR